MSLYILPEGKDEYIVLKKQIVLKNEEFYSTGSNYIRVIVEYEHIKHLDNDDMQFLWYSNKKTLTFKASYLKPVKKNKKTILL